MSEQPKTDKRKKIGMILGVAWLVVLMIALSGQCLAKPKQVTQDMLFSPPPEAPPTDQPTPGNNTTQPE